MQRIIAYIDGFNLYFGLRARGWRRFYWLDVRMLVKNLLKPDQRLECVRYFTTRVSSTPGDPHQNKRQAVYLDALETLPSTSLHYGHYLEKPFSCHKCGCSWSSHEEKMTDVNIATELVVDAYEDRFDTAMLISGDSDLKRPIECVRTRFPKKRVIVAFPPERHSVQLQRAANAYFTISRKKLKDSQLPDLVKKADGFELRRPSSWR